MKYHLFQYPLPAPPELEDLNAFLNTQRVAAVSHHVVAQPGGALLVFVVQTVGGGPARPGGPAGPKIDYREVLKAEEFRVYSQLRSERKRWAETEGVPVYTVFTNAQLAEMVTRRARTVADLGAVEGVGAARVEKYGARLLALLAELSAAPAPEVTP